MTDSAEHFAAFSFVDRITEFTPGIGARGEFHVPAALRAFPACLVAEAVGQLAAWVAMEHLGYRGRPVAALAGETHFHGDVLPGDTIQLTVALDEVDDDVVSYRGWADVNGTRVIELNDCLGPMLPVADFDAPEALRERFALLRGAGALPDRFTGVVDPAVTMVEHIAGRSMRAVMQIPTMASFFADHFPRRPVFPATLLLNAQIKLAGALARETRGGGHGGGAEPVASRMTRVKMRAFIVPGQEVDFQAEVVDTENSGTQDRVVRIALTTRDGDGDGKTIATARVEFIAVIAA